MGTNQTEKCILLIEDDEDVLSMMVKHLTYHGYRLLIAKDGMEGLKKVETDQYDLVITDIIMPYVSGSGVIARLKKSRPHIPVIAITGYGKESEAVATEKKADLVLAKPIKMSVLKEHITDLLGSS